MYILGTYGRWQFYPFNNTRIILLRSTAATSITQEFMTDAVAAARVVGGKPPGTLFPLLGGFFPSCQHLLQKLQIWQVTINHLNVQADHTYVHIPQVCDNNSTYLVLQTVLLLQLVLLPCHLGKNTSRFSCKRTYQSLLLP